MPRLTRRSAIVAAVAGAAAAAQPRVPAIAGDWWRIAGPPDLGKFSTPKQEVVDFAVWQALDSSWQAWSCIRHTAEVGATRLFHRWQGPSLTGTGWEPMGIAMRADPAFGERPGSMQAPYVMKAGGKYHMYYTSGGRLFLATSDDGKTFARQMTSPGKFGVYESFGGDAEQKVIGGGGRDIMILRDGSRYVAYYTANPDGLGKVYARISTDLRVWSDPRVVAFGGEAGTGPYSAECPFVYRLPGTPYYYLFRTQKYRTSPETRVYRSTDPLQFGIETDEYLVNRLDVAAPELVEHDKTLYIVCLETELDGLRAARLEFRA